MKADTKFIFDASIMGSLCAILLIGGGYLIYRSNEADAAIQIECIKAGKSIIQGNCVKVQP